MIRLIFTALFLGGCACKPIVEYKEIPIAVKCDVTLPDKPVFIATDLNSSVEVAKYYEEVEELLLQCIK